MKHLESIFDKLHDKSFGLDIALNQPACITAIEKLEKLLRYSLPSEIKQFYLLANGFETDDYLFRVIPIEEMLNSKNGLEDNRLFFAEYMIYSDTWEIILEKDEIEKYKIVSSDHKSEETIALTNSIFEFIEYYLVNGGVFGEKGLYFWFEEQKRKNFT